MFYMVILKVFLIVILSLLLLVMSLVIFSRCYFKRSLMATLCEIYLRLSYKKETKEKVIADIKNLNKRHDDKVKKLMNKNFKNCVKFDVSGIKVLGFNGIDILSFNKNETIEKDDVAVIYFHGGGYVRPPRNHHISFIKKFANKSRLPIYFATYPTAPKNTCKDVLPLVENLYKNVCKHYNKTILMGDSSGGGLALCLSKILLEKKEVLPTKTILFAPWVDVSLTNPELEDYQKVDPFIDFKHEQIWGKLWAGNLDVKDEKVSPMFADFKGLNDVVLYVGTREVLYPDIVKFSKKLKDEGVNVALIEGVGMNHVYPIYPIPEARKVRKEIIKEINNL